MTRASGKTSLMCNILINMFNDNDLIVCMYKDNVYVKALCRTSLKGEFTSSNFYFTVLMLLGIMSIVVITIYFYMRI